MHLPYRNSTVAVLVLVGVLLLSGGCAKRTHAVVKGQVKFFDKTLTAGTVTFISEDGQRTGSGNIDFSGNYTVGNAPVGPCTVTVRVPNVAAMPPGMRGGPKPPGSMPPMRPPGGEAEDSGPLIDPAKVVQIPAKYGKPETSGLTYTVAPGEQTIDITLTP